MLLPYFSGCGRVLFAVVNALVVAVGSYDALRLLQAGSYRVRRGYRRIFRSRSFALGCVATALLLSLKVLAKGKAFVFCGAYFLMVASWLGITLCRKRRTPLRFTPRIRRLVGTLILLAAVEGYFFAGEVLFCLFPSLVLLAHGSNLPTETAIHAYYLQKAKRTLRRANVKIIAVVGSYGKTSVKTFLTEFLSLRYTVLKTKNSYNTPLGLAKTVNEEYRGEEIFVAEFGARQTGDIRKLMKLVSPDCVVLTGITSCHLSTFGSLENVVRTKYESITHLKEGGFAVFNGADEICQTLFERTQKPKFCFGKDCRYTDATFSEQGAKFSLWFGQTRYDCTTPTLGRAHVNNVCLAAYTAFLWGVPAEKIAEATAFLPQVPHRLELTKSGGLFLLDDGYNSNPVGFRNAMEVLQGFSGKKFVVTAGIVEQGRETEAVNVAAGRELRVADYVALWGPNAPYLKRGLTETGFSEQNLFEVHSLTQGVAAFQGFFQSGDVVLFENDLPDDFLKEGL